MRARHRRRVADHAVGAQRGNALHILVGDRKAEYIRIIANARRRRRFRNRHDAALHEPAHAKLGNAHAVFGRRFHEQLALECLTLDKRAPCFGQDMIFFTIRDHILLRALWVHLHLIEHRIDRKIRFDDLDVLFQKVARPRRAQFAVFVKPLKRAPCVAQILSYMILIFHKHGPVDQICVEIVRSELLQRAFTRRNRFFVTVVGVGQLADEKDLAARHAAFAQALAHARFVLICACRIDMAVAALQGAAHRRRGDVVRHFPSAERNARHSYTVIKGIRIL